MDNEKTLDKIISICGKDPQLKILWKMGNIMTMKRLNYNDHGPVHAKIVAHNALKIYEILFPLKDKFKWNTCTQAGLSYEDGKNIVYIASILHDIGNAIHREHHERWSVILAEDIIDKILYQTYRKDVGEKIKTEILHAIISHEDMEAHTLEASCVKIGDALDMTKGRSRIPIIKGRFSIHSESANAIDSVNIKKGNSIRPLRITISMHNPAGIFQIDQLLMQRIQTSVLRNNVRLIAKINGKTKVIYV